MGPLAGIKVLEIKGIGPGPYAGQLLADMGADVVVVERASRPTGIGAPSGTDVNSRGKRSIALDLKNEAGLAALLRLVEGADVLFEGFRPGVAERLGFGPDVCHERNPALVYGRITGWGQTGPLANAAGHDINYISLTGSLAAVGTKEKPVPPLNLVGDYAGGSLFLVMGILAALLEARESGKGQVVDAAITDGSAHLMSIFYTMSHAGQLLPNRASNMLDGGAYFYDVYETADNKFISLGPIEPQFHALLVEKLGLDPELFSTHLDTEKWPVQRQALSEAIKQKTRDEWCELLEGTDACFAPVLDMHEASSHAHNQARGTYVEIDGKTQPAPAPQFSRSVCDTPSAPRSEGADTKSVLTAWGFSDADIRKLDESGALT